MIFESREAMIDYLREQRNFQECLLMAIIWGHFGTVIELVFDYTWASDGSLRPEYASADVRTLVLRNVQELHVSNALNEHMILHPEQLDWGLSEVSSVRLCDDQRFLTRYQSLAIPFHHLQCAWEGERQVDIVFSPLEAK